MPLESIKLSPPDLSRKIKKKRESFKRRDKERAVMEIEAGGGGIEQILVEFGRIKEENSCLSPSIHTFL